MKYTNLALWIEYFEFLKSIKLLDFAADIGFDTSCNSNEMSQMHEFCPSNSVSTIFYGNNYCNIYLTATEP